jgi:hypothetical protein
MSEHLPSAEDEAAAAELNQRYAALLESHFLSQ